MIFEMTQDYEVIVPLMISNLISFFISSRLQRAPIYEALAVQDGIHLPTAESRRGAQHQIIGIMRPPGAESLPAQTKIREAIDRIRASSIQSCLVTDSSRVLGVLNLDGLQRELANGDSKTVGELVKETNFPHVHADQSLDLALERM